MNVLNILNGIVETALLKVNTYNTQIAVINYYDDSTKPFIYFDISDLRFDFIKAEKSIFRLNKGTAELIVHFVKSVESVNYADNIDEIGKYIDTINNVLHTVKPITHTITDEITGSNQFTFTFENIEINSVKFVSADENIKDINIRLDGILNFNIMYF